MLCCAMKVLSEHLHDIESNEYHIAKKNRREINEIPHDPLERKDILR